METGELQDDWTLKNLDTFNLDPALLIMLEEMFKAPSIHQPSKFWKTYVKLNIKQLQEEGINNFKNTVNKNYFLWTGGNLREQRHALIKSLGIPHFLFAYVCSVLFPQLEFKPVFWNLSQWQKYKYFLHMLYMFAKLNDKQGLLHDLSEPLDGSPYVIEINKRLISQDLCNSVIEVNSASVPRRSETKRHFIELGAGYGRVAYCIMKTFTNVKYTIIDIPPALYIAQWYLSKTLPDKKFFKFRKFNSYSDISNEFENADVAFLLPHQAEYLPDKTCNLFINISSLHEMNKEQISYWFNQINRLCKGLFYTKQWIVHQNRQDGIVIKREDYPVNSQWEEIYNRRCTIQPRFFEALYKI